MRPVRKELELGSAWMCVMLVRTLKLVLTRRVFIKLTTELTYDPAIPLFAIYPEKNMVQKHT